MRASDPLMSQLADYAADAAVQDHSALPATDYGPRTTVSRQWHLARDIALAMGAHKKTVHRLAARESWPTRDIDNRREYQPPPRIASLLVPSPDSELRTTDNGLRTVRFADLVHDPRARELVLLRQQAVLVLERTISQHGIERSLDLVASSFSATHPAMPISSRSLRRWRDAYARDGLDGLVEQKRGHSGRKSIASQLDQADILRTTAGAIEYGAPRKGTASGRLNVARAFRDLVADPTVTGPAREHLHGNHASKSYVPPSVRAAVRAHAAPLTTTRLQIGPKAAKLDGPYIECSYDNLPSYHAVTADDMTCNEYVWCEWPGEPGWLLIRPQLLAVLDIGSLCWLCLRIVMRPKGSYGKDDVWGVLGDCLDSFGLFKIAVLEGGSWQSDLVVGQRTGIDDDTRFGGLKSLGVKVVHTRSPRGKIIEGAFNSLQSAADRVAGSCGRDERTGPEITKQHLALCRAGKAHPRQFFLHVNEFRNHIATVMQNLNNERNDGKVCKGQSPREKWESDRIPAALMPDSAKWMYRSSFSCVKVTRNGVRITEGTGAHKLVYTYHDPALETWRGQHVICYWNNSNPDTDACVYTVRDGKPHTLIAVAKRVKELPRFGATDEQMSAQKRRIAMSHNLAVSQSASLAPYLQRTSVPSVPSVPLPSEADEIAEAVQSTRQAAEARANQARANRRAVTRVSLTPDDVSAATDHGPRTTDSPNDFSADEVSALFSNES